MRQVFPRVLRALLGKQGILFLAPTGKARVRLGQKTGQPSMTVTQHLATAFSKDSKPSSKVERR
jgi:ATP-dependent exoDNAse (exonuclease V) alpha subunit